MLQEPDIRKDFAWDPGWVGKVIAPTLLLWTDHDPTGGLELVDAPDGLWSRPPTFESGAGGLVSTVDDWLAFGRSLLGPADGPPLLSPASVAQMIIAESVLSYLQVGLPPPQATWVSGRG